MPSTKIDAYHLLTIKIIVSAARHLFGKVVSR